MLKIKVLIAKLLVNNFNGRIISILFSNKIPFYNIKIDISNPIIKRRIAAALFFKTYESSEIRYIKKHINNYKGIIIELGSSIGVVSSIVAKDNPKAIVYTFEADERFIPIVKNNYLINDINNANSFQGIIGEEGYEFSVGEDNTMGKILKSNNSNQTLTNLSSIVEKNNIGDFALISDIEGAEYFILNENKNVFNNCTLIIMEMHDIEIEDKVIKVEDLVNRVLELGFTIVERYGSNIVAKKM
ncbi:MAG: FkbM family methyltransferase [Flavobacterium sp.]|jgi:FkbM family methyltransferase